MVAVILMLLLAVSTGEAAPGKVAQTKSAADFQSSAKYYKELGDQYVSKERLTKAVDAYEWALSLGRNQFTVDERVQMAVYLSWENRLDAAIDELRRVLQQDPQHVEARIHLARVYSWTGALGMSIAEADEVLRTSADNPEALLVKADALAWQGHFRQAIPIYREILDRESRFDARLGLSYALLSGGNQAAASQNARNLAAASLRQKDQLSKLIDAIDSAARPKVDLRHSQYQDSDDNHMDRYSLLYGFGLGNQNFELNLKHTDTRRQTGKSRSDRASFSILSNITEGLRWGAGVGLTRSESGTKRNLATGQFRIEAAVSNATVGASVGTDILTDTSELIENRIRATSYSAQVSKPWTGRFSTYGTYTYKAFSDGNRAHDMQFAPQYTINFVPRVSIGYRFRFLDFREQSGSGFFDPNNYASHRLFTSISVEKKKISTYLDVFAGKQSFVRYAFPTNDWIVGGSASIGFKPIRQLTIEVNGEAGNFDAGSVAGFKYSIVGTKVSYRF